MILAVLDTNALASGAVATGGTIGTLIDAWLVDNIYAVALSAPTWASLAAPRRSPFFTQRIALSDIAAYQTKILAAATIVPVTAPVPAVVRSRADNLVLATAESARAPYVVSGDRELQQLGRYRNVAILSPREFLDLLEREGVLAP